MTRRVRVLVVDDSAFARKTLRLVLTSSPRIEVVGSARDGLEALEKIASLKPDVVTLDLMMPNLDGLGVLRALPREDAPRVLVVSITDANSELAISALQLGAVDLVQKPTALATDRLFELNDELVQKVLAAAQAKPGVSSAVERAPMPLSLAVTSARLLVVGASTGGPQAITRLLSALPGNFPIPIAVALHIPAGYTDTLASRLNELCQLDVAEAREGMAFRPGLAILAQGGQHLTVRMRQQQLYAHVGGPPYQGLYYPSVDLLFESAAEQLGSGVRGVVLTGMGDDGCRGAQAIRRAGGVVLTEDESSCVVFGMPRAVVEAGYSSGSAPLMQLPELIVAHL